MALVSKLDERGEIARDLRSITGADPEPRILSRPLPATQTHTLRLAGIFPSEPALERRSRPSTEQVKHWRQKQNLLNIEKLKLTHPSKKTRRKTTL
jgi:hypothetical protein